MWSDVVNFFNSNFFSGLITIFVGSFAYGVYRKQKRDAKQRAAEIILLEIEEAEQRLTKVSVSRPFPDLTEEQVVLMPVASWDNYKHLFINDFDRNETDKISDFYARCADYDDASSLNASIVFERFQQELNTNMQRILADYARDYNDAAEQAGDDEDKLRELEQDYIERRKRFIDIYSNASETHMFTYVPVKPYNDAVRALQGLEQSLSLTSVGIKIKAIARHRNWLQVAAGKLSGGR